MCGRYSFITSREKLEKEFKIKVPDNLRANYNISPTQLAYIVSNEEPDSLQLFRWGLIPNWAENVTSGENLINAYKEGIASKTSFRIPIRKKRCLVFADSFYLWKRIERSRIPYRVSMIDNSVMVFAGIWDSWINKQNEEIKSFSILTVNSNKDLFHISDRMPALLRTKKEQFEWLQQQSLDDILAMIKPLKEGILDVYRISSMIDSTKSNSKDLHKKYDDLPTLFD